MTDEQIQIAIAESVGLGERIALETKWKEGTVPFSSSIPNYPMILDSMHMVEKSLSDEEYSEYVHILNGVCISTADEGMKKGRSRIVSATAHQRAEAYLRVKHLWKE